MRLTGIASTSRLDHEGDVIPAFEFAAQINDPASIPLLWQHSGEPIGTIDKLYYDSKGRLIIECGTFDIRARTAKGFSVGYRANRTRSKWQLTEISLTGNTPANPDCVITHRDTSGIRKLSPTEQYDQLMGLNQ